MYGTVSYVYVPEGDMMFFLWPLMVILTGVSVFFIGGPLDLAVRVAVVALVALLAILAVFAIGGKSPLFLFDEIMVTLFGRRTRSAMHDRARTHLLACFGCVVVVWAFHDAYGLLAAGIAAVTAGTAMYLLYTVLFDLGKYDPRLAGDYDHEPVNKPEGE